MLTLFNGSASFRERFRTKTPGSYCLSQGSLLERSAAHTRGGADGRQECCERGYYHLHRKLDDLLFLHTICVFSRKEEGDYSGGGLSALRVTSSPPKLGGVRGGLNKRYNYRGLLHWPFFRPPLTPPNSGGEEVTKVRLLRA